MEQNHQMIAIEEEFTGSLKEINVNEPCPVVENDEAVITTLHRLNVRDKEIDRIKSQCQLMREKIDQWEKSQIEKIESQKQWFLTPLKSFMESINRSNPKIKSLKFPVGTIGLRKTPQRIEIDPEFVPADHIDDPFVSAKITYAVNKSAIAKVVKETGEIPEYAAVVSGEQKFYYRGE